MASNLTIQADEPTPTLTVIVTEHSTDFSTVEIKLGSTGVTIFVRSLSDISGLGSMITLAAAEVVDNETGKAEMTAVIER